MRDPASGPVHKRVVALVGNPNTGKSTVFNALTGLRQKIGNYPGVTVEKKEGHCTGMDGSDLTVIDLPGTYSLTPHSPDEHVAVDVVLGRRDDTPVPDIVLCIVDASNLERNLYLASQLIDRGLPLVLGLTMLDVARQRGMLVSHETLSRELGVPVIPLAPQKGIGIARLKETISSRQKFQGRARQWKLPEPVMRECEELVHMLRQRDHLDDNAAFHEALDLISAPADALERIDHHDPELIAHVRKDHQKLEFLGFDRSSVVVTSRYAWLKQVCSRSVERASHPGMTRSDRIDRVLTHRVWGLLIFIGIMGFVFHSIFSWATLPMEWIGEGFDWLGAQIGSSMPPGELRDLLVNGGVAGVAAVVTFLPQILLLFFFLGILEDSGYLARAAYMLDRLMSKVGLHGKSFIPLLSSFACAIPGLMAARTIDNPKDRLVTMLVSPLVSCSARLPVYALLIGAFIPGTTVLGFFSLPALTLLGLYLFGLTAALGMALLFKKTLLKGSAPELIIELPPYTLPSVKVVLLHVWEKAASFLRAAGTIILAASIVLWFLASHPRLQDAPPSERLQQSYAGQAGRLIEPLLQPLGFNWKIGVGLVTSLLQREVFVSTMATIYNLQDAQHDKPSVSLRSHLQADRDAVTGVPTFTALTALCVMIYYVLAMQCFSTVVVMRRETKGWKWPLFQIAYMTTLAYSVTFLVHRIGLAMGAGG